MKKNDAFRVSVTIPMSPQTTLSGIPFFSLLQVKHTQKRKKNYTINKVIKTTKKQIANLHTYMAIYLQ